MTDYLMMITERAATCAAEVARRVEDHRAFAARHATVTLDAGWLRPRCEAVRVWRDRATDGAFDDAFDRYYWMRAGDVDHAAALASEIALGDGESIEVRPLIGGVPHAGKLDHPGKVFMFSVLAAASDEPTWCEVMEMIARETEDAVPPDRFIGGLRLRAPSTGKRIVLDSAKRRVIDGPFLESKEVIGGLFFMRMTRIDEAIAWASGSPFVARGALEIRELWRM